MQNQLTNRMHNQKNTLPFGNVQNFLFHLRLRMTSFSFNLGCSESKVIFKWRKKKQTNKQTNDMFLTERM